MSALEAEQRLRDALAEFARNDDEREEFMEAMRGTMAFAVTRFDYAWSDLIEGSRLARFVRWSDRKLNRRRGAA